MRLSPSAAAWLLAAAAALGLAGSVYAIPIQVSEAAELIEFVAPLPSATEAFREGLESSPTLLRPMRWVQTWWLLQVGHTLGDRFHLVFRGYHALLGALLVLLFTAAARPRTWTDTSALAVALAVLMGTQTFAGMFREAYPVNHFLLIALFALALYLIARSDGGLVADVGAVALLGVAVLTIESGLLLVPVAAAAYMAGARGISRRALLAMVAVVVAYVVLRVGVLQIHTDPLGARGTGFGAVVLSSEDVVSRFGANPFPLYAYNATMAVLSVLLSQPTAGQWTVIAAWQNGTLTPSYAIQITSSVLTTGVIAWFIASRREDARRRWREPLVVVAAALLACNAAISFNYSKAEIMSVSGVFYALLAYAAVAALLAGPARSWMHASGVAVLMVLLGGTWAMRTAGLHYQLAYAAFDARGQWSGTLRPGHQDDWPRDPAALTTLQAIKTEAIGQRRASAKVLPRWHQDWWGPP